MRIKFVCTPCLVKWRRDFTWVDHHWTTLNGALAHLKEHPSHEIEAETEYDVVADTNSED